MRGADEAAVVRRPLDLDHGVVHLATRAGERFLELGLVVHVARAGVLDLVREGGDVRRLDLLEAVLEIKGCDRSLEQRREDVPAPRDPLELVRRDVACTVRHLRSEAELLRHRGAALPRDDVRPDLREPSLRGVGEAVEDGASDRELEHAVAEELEPLVRRRAIVRPRGVGQDLREPLCGKLGDQAAELVRPVRDAATPGAR